MHTNSLCSVASTYIVYGTYSKLLTSKVSCLYGEGYHQSGKDSNGVSIFKFNKLSQVFEDSGEVK